MGRKPRRSRLGSDDNAHLVFVSHATADKWIAKTICEKIDDAGASTFRDDRDIAGGDDIPAEIRSKLLESTEMVVLITPASIGRPWVLFEVGAFWGRRQSARIVAVLCHVEFDSIPELIRSKKAISLNEFDDYLVELKGRLARKRRK